MAQRKGQTGNPAGRPKGVPNKSSKTTRDFITQLIDRNQGQIVKDLKSLEPKDRLMILEKLLAYTVPKMTASNITIGDLSNENLETLINHTVKNIESGNTDQ